MSGGAGAPGSPSHVLRVILRSKTGVAGAGILAVLACMSAAALAMDAAAPAQPAAAGADGWSNPSKWISYPRTAMPAWVNLFAGRTIPEHIIIHGHVGGDGGGGEGWKDIAGTGAAPAHHPQVTALRYPFTFDYGGYPSGMVYDLQVRYSAPSPLIEARLQRPDGTSLPLLTTSLPHARAESTHQTRVFSADALVKKNLVLHSAHLYDFEITGMPAEQIMFSSTGGEGGVLTGRYVLEVDVVGYGAAEAVDSRLVVGGKAFGLMGTDELRRDLAVGLLRGTPLALFIGMAVAIGSVAAGLMYGVYAGYRGGTADEVMMRLNDVVYALPALPFLIILAVTISSSIFVMIGFLMMFGWVGVAKVSRSMALQLRTRGYVEAARMMGQSNARIITRHMLPQLLPYAFASVAISVPAAITAEAGLSFLGLGDPDHPTWGQMLHDAGTYGAAARGLWWWVLPPGAMIAVTGLAFVLIGNAAGRVANPGPGR